MTDYTLKENKDGRMWVIEGLKADPETIKWREDTAWDDKPIDTKEYVSPDSCGYTAESIIDEFHTALYDKYQVTTTLKEGDTITLPAGKMMCYKEWFDADVSPHQQIKKIMVKYPKTVFSCSSIHVNNDTIRQDNHSLVYDNEHYTHFVVQNGRVQSGWEYKEDAQEAMADLPRNEHKARIYTRKYLINSLGV
jgi:hypothetical protein